MALGVNTDGSQTAVITTEHDLATITAANVYQLIVDVSAMTNGSTPDALEITEYIKPRSGGTERKLHTYRLRGAQSNTAFATIPRTIAVHIRYTLKQTQGTGRAYPWAVYQVQ